ncbi:MAG: integrase core domain-containing protein, partial [Pseudomonadota bacterium]
IWLGRFHTQTTFIDPGKPWQNGYVESFHSKLRDECLNMHVFRTGQEAIAEIEQWRQFYNQTRPHSSLNNLSPEQFIQSLNKVA